MSNDWKTAIASRFHGRDQLPKEELCHQFWNDLPEQDVLEALAAIQTEGDVAIGLMRPSDEMATLFAPPLTRNIFTWLRHQIHSGDADLALSQLLTRRLKAYGRLKEWRNRVKTLDDFVRAWCGSSPAEECNGVRRAAASRPGE